MEGAGEVKIMIRCFKMPEHTSRNK